MKRVPVKTIIGFGIGGAGAIALLALAAKQGWINFQAPGSRIRSVTGRR